MCLDIPNSPHAYTCGGLSPQAAERAAGEQLNLKALELFFIGNAPIAHFSPAGKAGETHFLYRASYIEGVVQPAGKGVFSGARASLRGPTSPYSRRPAGTGGF